LSLQVPEIGAVGSSLEERDWPWPGCSRYPKSQPRFLPGAHWHISFPSFPEPHSLRAGSQARLNLMSAHILCVAFFFLVTSIWCLGGRAFNPPVFPFPKRGWLQWRMKTISVSPPSLLQLPFFSVSYKIVPYSDENCNTNS
jgi:hypothetical protein